MTQQAIPHGRKDARCTTCTIKLVAIAYQRTPWFRLVREPLRFGMRLWAWISRLDPSEYDVRTPACYGCIRFYKSALKERSRIFRFLNKHINPLFNALMERIVTVEEVQQAKAFAHQAGEGNLHAGKR